MASSADKEKLPPGWISQHNEFVGSSEYIDEATGRKYLLHPNAPAPAKVSHPWEVIKEPNGIIYYANSETREYTYKNPIEEERIKQSAKKEDDWIVGYWYDERLPDGEWEVWYVDYRTGELFFASIWKKMDDE